MQRHRRTVVRAGVRSWLAVQRFDANSLATAKGVSHSLAAIFIFGKLPCAIACKHAGVMNGDSA